MIAYAKQAREAESTSNALRFRCRELELSIEQLDEQYKLERAAWIVAHAAQLGADVEKALTSSSVVAMKRNAIEAQILAEYPFVFFIDVAANKLELATLELQYRAARTDATYYKMLFLASLRGFSDVDETPYEPDTLIHAPELLTPDEINAQFEQAEQVEFTVDRTEMHRERVERDELLEALAAGYEQESTYDIINVL